MAQIDGVLSTPVLIEELNLIEGLPVGPLTSPDIIDQPPIGISQIIANRFPVPPVAAAFLTTITDEDGNEPFGISMVSGNPISAALAPQSIYLEPTIGQIWPR